MKKNRSKRDSRKTAYHAGSGMAIGAAIGTAVGLIVDAAIDAHERE